MRVVLIVSICTESIQGLNYKYQNTVNAVPVTLCHLLASTWQSPLACKFLHNHILYTGYMQKIFSCLISKGIYVLGLSEHYNKGICIVFHLSLTWCFIILSESFLFLERGIFLCKQSVHLFISVIIPLLVVVIVSESWELGSLWHECINYLCIIEEVGSFICSLQLITLRTVPGSCPSSALEKLELLLSGNNDQWWHYPCFTIEL